MKLLAVNLDANSEYSVFAVSATVHHYGYPSLPVRLPKPYANIIFLES
jgi:hypothetical protein